MKKTFYLMRHGQTLFNLREKLQGWCDSPLTELGKKQAEIAANYFKDNHIIFDHAYCSTSERTSDTLEIVLDTIESPMPYTRLKGLKEINFGTYEGESEDLKPKTIEELETFFVPFGGEDRGAVRERMKKTCTEIMESDDHQTVLAVSHGGSCYNFLKVWQDPEEERAKGIPNCCIFKYEYEDKTFKLIEVIRPEK
jgi:probable phosphoglycerate mutase